MERRMIRRLYGIGVLFAVALSFMTCSNPIDILQSITTEVKSANGKFLIVTQVGPTPNATSVSPGTQVVIVFDRSVDPKTLTAGVVFDPPIQAGYEYNDATRTLTITPATMDGGKNYSVTVTKALKGKDTSELQDEYVWTFKTASVPYGTFTIQGSAGSRPGYSLATPVTLMISPNPQAMQMRFRETPWNDQENDVGWTTKDVTHDFPLSPGEGTKTIYMQFATLDGLVMSEVVSSTIILDSTPPTVAAGSMSPLCTLALTRTTSASALDANNIATYSWTKDSGPGTVTFGSPSALNTAISASVDGNYVVRLTVTDNAGLSNSSTLSVLRDTVVDSVSAGAGPIVLWPGGLTATLNGSASDSAGSPSLLWTGAGLSFGSPAGASTSVSGSADGSYTATLTASDAYGNTKSASVQIIRDTVAPTVSIVGSIKYINIGTPSPILNGSASDSAGIKSYLWTGPGLTFGTPTTAATTVMAGTDGTYTATLTATDIGGNSSTASITVTRDTLAPGAPLFNSITTPTLSNTPTWTWNTGGGGNGVYTVLLLNPAGGKVWKDELKSKPPLTFPVDAAYLAMLTKNKIYPLNDGLWTLQVAEYDDAGNSAIASSAILVTPVLPPDNATVNPELPIHFEWRPMTTGYGIYYAVAPKTTFVLLGETKAINYINIPAGTLTAGYTYYWYIKGATVLPVGAPKTYFTVIVK